MSGLGKRPRPSDDPTASVAPNILEEELAEPTSKRVSTLPGCFFGSKCYRRNPHHFREYSHDYLLELCLQYGNNAPPVEKLAQYGAGAEVVLAQLQVYAEVCKDVISNAVDSKSSSEKCKSSCTTDLTEQAAGLSFIQKKLKLGEPLSLFLTKVKDSPTTHKDMNSIYISELFHPSLGLMKRSLQINFMVEWEWLKMNYEVTNNQDKPLLIIHGEENSELSPSNLPSHVRAVRVKPRFPFGTHHTKIMIIEYEDESVRVVVSTANLVASDWENRTQGVWIGPRCPKLKAPTDVGDSKTEFKSSLLRYLRFYEVIPLKSYIDAINRCDFSQVNVFFISSVPNSHKGPDLNLWGHRQVASLLRKHLSCPASNWPIVMQCSSIGSLGANEDLWFKGEIGQSLSSAKQILSSIAPIALIYPSKKDVFQSYDGIFGGGCLPYSRKTHEKQPWLDNYLHRWRAEKNARSKAMPHIKTYTRLSPDCSKAAYFVLTSANLSKTAWGISSKVNDSLQIQSYEAGVLFLPKFISGKECFEVGKDLQLPYDVPLVKYSPECSSWLMDYLREAAV